MINDPTSNLWTYKGGFEASPPKHALLPPSQPHPTTTTFIEDQINGLHFYKAQEILGEPPTQLGYKPLPRSPSPGCAHSISILFSFGLRLLCFHVFALSFSFIFSKSLSRTDGFSTKKRRIYPFQNSLALLLSFTFHDFKHYIPLFILLLTFRV